MRRDDLGVAMYVGRFNGVLVLSETDRREITGDAGASRILLVDALKALAILRRDLLGVALAEAPN